MQDPATISPKLKPTNAAHPFDKPDADIVLRSSDLVDFRVRKHILFEASPVFESILSIPQPTSCDTTPPVVELVEESTTLDILLRICYPIVKPTSQWSLEDSARALNGARKYDMELPIALLTNELVAAASHSPMQVWAIACRTGLEEIALHAAKATLVIPQLDFASLGRMEDISAGDYFRLLQFHRANGIVDQPNFRLLTPPSPSPDAPAKSPMCHPVVRNVDMICRSSDGVDLEVNKSLLSAGSASMMTEKIDGLLGIEKNASDMSSKTSSSLPVLLVDEPVRRLNSLVTICCCRTFALPSDPYDYAELLGIALKYQVHDAAATLLRGWCGPIERNPMGAYFAAVIHGLPDCAREAAKKTLATLPADTVYLEIMEEAPAHAMHTLLRYHEACRSVVADALTTFKWTLPRDLFTRTADREDNSLVLQYLAGMTDDERPEPGLPQTRTPYRHSRYTLLQRPDPPPTAGTRVENSPYVWLSSYVNEVSEIAQRDPQRVSELAGLPWERATSAGTWCPTCHPFALAVSQLCSTLQDSAREAELVTLDL